MSWSSDSEDEMSDVSDCAPLGPPVLEIESIQGYMPSNAEIRRTAVLRVDTIADQFNPLMGVSDCTKLCPTCKNTMHMCPGHHGYMELSIPLPRVFFVPQLVDLLNKVCFRCMRIRIGSHSQRCRHCEFRHLEWITDKTKIMIQAVHTLSEEDMAVYEAHGTKPLQITPQDLYACLSSLPESTALETGFAQAPDALMWKNLVIPSINTRPNHHFAKMGANPSMYINDWSKQIRGIISAERRLRTVISEGETQPINIVRYKYKKSIFVSYQQCFSKIRGEHQPPATQIKAPEGALEQAWMNLMRAIATFHSSKHKRINSVARPSYGGPLQNVEDRYKFQKSGRFRANIIARRVDNALRGVLEGTIQLRVDEVGIPKREMMLLSIPVYVTRFNVRVVQKWVRNGPYRHPGANYITYKDGREVDLVHVKNRRDIDVSKIRLVRRHILVGDTVLVNRQPTLHRGSMQALKVRMHENHVIRLHYAIFTPLGADCDGDEINVHIPQSMMARAELEECLGVARGVIRDGKVWIKFIQNAVVGAYLLSKQDTVLSYRDALNLLTRVDLNLAALNADRLRCISGDGMVPGRAIVSCLFPVELSITQGDLRIEAGVMKSGQLNSQNLNGHRGIIATLSRTQSGPRVLEFIYFGYLLFQGYLDMFGLSVGLGDMYSMSSPCRREAKLVAARMQRHLHSHQDEAGEQDIRQHLYYATQQMEENTKRDFSAVRGPNFRPGANNGLVHCILSGAKGSITTLQMMNTMIGQSFTLHQRYDKRTSHFRDDDKHNIFARGFVTDNYTEGVSVLSSILEAPATCESVIRKNKGTAKSGYSVRKLTTCLLGVVTNQKQQVLDCQGRLLWDVYGDDGYSCDLLTQIPLTSLPSHTFPEAYRATLPNTLRPRLDAFCRESGGKPMMKPGLSASVPCPVDFDQLLQECVLHDSAQGTCAAQSSLAKRVEGVINAVETFLYDAVHTWRIIRDSNLLLQRFVRCYFGPVHTILKLGLNPNTVQWGLRKARRRIQKCTVQNGESVGVIATQCLGEPLTQMSLKTPHMSGKFETATPGSQRVVDLLDAQFDKCPRMHIPLDPRRVTSEYEAIRLANQFVRIYLIDVADVRYPVKQTHSDGVTRIYCRLEPDQMCKRTLSPQSLCQLLEQNIIGAQCSTHGTDGEEWFLEMHLRRSETERANVLWRRIACRTLLRGFVDDYHIKSAEDGFIIETTGSDVEKLVEHPVFMSYAITDKFYSTNILEMYQVFGLICARRCLEREFCSIMSSLTTSRHIKLLCRAMTSDRSPMGTKLRELGRFCTPLQRASYEQTCTQITQYCVRGETDNCSTIAGAALANTPMQVGSHFDTRLVFDRKRRVNPAYRTRQKHARYPKDIWVAPITPGARRGFMLFARVHGAKCVFDYDLRTKRQTLRSAFLCHQMPSTLFSGTLIEYIYTPQPDPGQQTVRILTDIFTVCGRHVVSLRYDERIQILAHALHLIAAQQKNAKYTLKLLTVYNGSRAEQLLDQDGIDAVMFIDSAAPRTLETPLGSVFQCSNN